MQEFRVRGVKTNIPFLINLVTHPEFLAGGCTTRFIDETPELFQFPSASDRATKLLTLPRRGDRQRQSAGEAPAGDSTRRRAGARPRATRISRAARRHAAAAPGAGAGAIRQWVLRAEAAAADRHDLPRRPPVAAGHAGAHLRHAARSPTPTPGSCRRLFSIEMWGGATFDTAMRFLKEDPWERLAQLREQIPNILFQMLLRGSNAVGYTNYPDNVVQGVRQGVGRRRASTCSASSTR